MAESKADRRLPDAHQATSRHAEFCNPLEKIEELLTCPICLDRYKSPKLLPCHHTFCHPCLEGCADTVRRVVKCPECRAEHTIPYDGVKSFQTNYTLTGFLEIHLQATEESAAELEAYIKRYNLERCKVCDEKAEVELCAHCEKRVCAECKTTHMEMVKRDLGRLMNQVKRLSNRITEASDGLSKGVELLTLNCETTKDEVKEYIRRYIRELKKKEEGYLVDIETFCATETRLMRNLRDVLELESSNVSEACALVEAVLKGEREVNEEDLIRYKQLFADGLEYLRNFQPDAEELFSKKLRFSPGDDANKLPAAIGAFGELNVSMPQFAGRFFPLEQAYVPRSFSIGLESDNYKTSRRIYDEPNQWKTTQNEPTTRSSRYLTATDRAKEDDSSLSTRYRRRDDPTYGRMRAESRLSPNRPSSRQQVEDDLSPGRSPWTRMPPVTSAETANSPSPTSSTTEARSKSVTTTAANNTAAASPNVASSVTATATAAAAVSKIPQTRSTSARKPPLPRQTSSTDDPALNEKVESIRQQHEQHKQDAQQQRQRKPTSGSKVIKASAQFKAPSVTTATSSSSPTSTEEEEEEEPKPAPLSVERRPSVTSITSLGSERKQSIPIVHYPGSSKPPINPQPPKRTSTLEATSSEDRADSDISTSSTARKETAAPANSGVLDWKKYLLPPNEPIDPKRMSLPPVDLASTNRTTSLATKPGETDFNWLERRKRFVRSKTNPELFGAIASSRVQDLIAGMSDKPSVSSSGARSRILDTPADIRRRRNLETQDSTETESEARPNDRRSRYRRRTSITDRATGTLNGSFESATDLSRGENSAEHQGAGNRFYRVFSQPKIDYAGKTKPKLMFGKKGGKEGEFNWPRGIAVIPACDEVVVCDSSNHRVQVFNSRGRLLRSFGKYGTGKGEFDCLAGIAPTRHGQFIVTDRYNHRVQVFEANGRFIREFGAHGQTNGKFNNPWGVVVDNQGFIYVCDKDNHRVQIFQADGNYVGKFGSLGNREGQFQNPHFIAVNKANQLIVTDSSNHRVQVFDHNGHVMFAFGSEGFHDGQFKYPRGVCVDDQGFIIVADSGNNRIQVFYPDGRFCASFGTWGSGEGQLKGVESVAIALDGSVIVSDRENHRIQLF